MCNLRKSGIAGSSLVILSAPLNVMVMFCSCTSNTILLLLLNKFKKFFIDLIMKKLALLFSFAALAFSANAQVYISGTSPYTENFDNIGSGIATAPGWSVYSGAAHNFLGSLATLTTPDGLPSYLSSDSSCIALVLVGGFKNFPSASVCHPGDDWCAATPPSYTNRALGVRQVAPGNASHPNLDSGAAFVFKLANTHGMTGLGMSFKLQSLDTASPRETTWLVDYAIGSSTTFTPVATTGYTVTGGHMFFDTAVTASFGTALDNSLLPVTIRIVTLVYSSSTVGSGNRASTAIDSFKLTWSGTAKTAVENVSAQPEVALTVLGSATSENVTFGYAVEQEGDYNFSVYDLSGRVLHTEVINATTGEQKLTLNGLNLVPGMYIAKLSNGNSSSVTKIAVQ